VPSSIDTSRAAPAIAAGGVAGATLRWAIAAGFGPHEFPWTLLVVNVVGSLVLGAVAFRAERGRREVARLALGIGFCGGLTTFSAFAVDTVALLDDERTGAAVAFVAASTGLAIAAVILGAAVRGRLDPPGTGAAGGDS